MARWRRPLESIGKAYVHGLSILAVFLFLTANWGTTMHLNWSWFANYLLLSILVTYPITQQYEKAIRFKQSKSPRNAATSLHAQDLIEHDKGSWWRVAHTKAVMEPFDDNVLQSVLIGIVRVTFRMVLLVSGPFIIIIKLVLWCWKNSKR